MVCKQLGLCIEDKNKECKREKDCIQFTDKRTCVKCEEKRKVYRLHNDCGVKIRKYQMDGGIVKNEKGFDACDNLLIIHDMDKKKAILKCRSGVWMIPCPVLMGCSIYELTGKIRRTTWILQAESYL